VTDAATVLSASGAMLYKLTPRVNSPPRS
jgi:hypothetical protein